MSRRIMILGVNLAVLLGVTSNVFGDVYNYWMPTSGIWSVAANWNLGVVPVMNYPGGTMFAIVDNGGLATTSASSSSDRLLIGGVTSGNVVTVSSGNDLHIQYELMFGSSTGGSSTLNLNQNASAYCEHLAVGIASGGSGTINVGDGATLTTGWWGTEVGIAGTGTINLTGTGTMIVNGNETTTNGHPGIAMNSTGHIDIAAGMLRVLGDRRAQLQGYINNHWITAYGEAGTVNTPIYDAEAGYTIVTAVPEAVIYASQPNPGNGATGVALNATLSWRASLGAQSHNVYFGTTGPGTFQGNQTATTFDPGPFAAFTTYYWRIDEVNGSNTVTGNVWNFTTSSGGRGLTLKLNRGITLDRQFTTIPPESIMTILPADIQIIKSMGFEFVKLIVNPACFISGSTINSSNMWYLDNIVRKVVSQGLPVVVCIHPMGEFKTNYLGSGGANFPALLGFYHDFAAYMAARWDPNELAFQLMTEPFGNYTAWNNMWPSMLAAVRSAMPDHTLIMSGDQAGIIQGLVYDVNPDLTTDTNILWSFTTYYPVIFTGQGGTSTVYYPWLNNVPYPSSPSNNPANYILPSMPSQYYSSAYNEIFTYCNTPWNMAKQRSILQSIVMWRANHPSSNPKVWCAEFGCLDRTYDPQGGGCNPQDRIQFIHDRRQAFEEIGIGWAYWSYNETFTVLNPNLRAAFSKSPSYDWIDNPTLDALGLPLCGCGCKVQPSSPSDLNKDCYVNASDLAMFASTWADCTEPNDPSCSL